MKLEGKTIDEERALYGLAEIEISDCEFKGPADGESALKECGRVAAKDCLFDLRYPLWHDRSVALDGCMFTPSCRAALWYSGDIAAKRSKLHGIKALRECKRADFTECEIVSPEFGWSSEDVYFTDCAVTSEYFMLRGKRIVADRLDFKGKYSFQYVENARISNSKLDTKDAFWHSKNVTVVNSVVIGEYLGWFSKNLTFINCTIVGTQPLCYCKGLRLEDCIMQRTDLAFERSRVNAVLRAPIDSIKNPYGGVIKVPAVGEIVRDDKNAKGRILIDPSLERK